MCPTLKIHVLKACSPVLFRGTLASWLIHSWIPTLGWWGGRKFVRWGLLEEGDLWRQALEAIFCPFSFLLHLYLSVTMFPSFYAALVCHILPAMTVCFPTRPVNPLRTMAKRNTSSLNLLTSVFWSHWRMKMEHDLSDMTWYQRNGYNWLVCANMENQDNKAPNHSLVPVWFAT